MSLFFSQVLARAVLRILGLAVRVSPQVDSAGLWAGPGSRHGKGSWDGRPQHGNSDMGLSACRCVTMTMTPVELAGGTICGRGGAAVNAW